MSKPEGELQDLAVQLCAGWLGITAAHPNSVCIVTRPAPANTMNAPGDPVCPCANGAHAVIACVGDTDRQRLCDCDDWVCSGEGDSDWCIYRTPSQAVTEARKQFITEIISPRTQEEPRRHRGVDEPGERFADSVRVGDFAWPKP